MKTIILPTQARDKHSENSKESGVFSQGCPTSPTPTSEYDGTSVRKTDASFFEFFPMFVPSLSWQNDRFYI